MLVRMKSLFFLPLTIAALFAGSSASAQEAAWQVRKASGEVWVTRGDVQPVSLAASSIVKAGDSIQTGRNGRVLLVRGEETILVSPNTVVGIPADQKDSRSTTITQQAGEILLEVEKRNVKHFEVTTPYLAAVVKGTQFRVTVADGNSRVDVIRGEVEVADFKSGQYALVLPGQTAKVLEQAPGLSLSGKGTLNPIQQGSPRVPAVRPVTLQREALVTPRGIGQQVRIAAPLGEVKVNVHEVTRGLAREASLSASGGGRGNADGNETKQTVWSSGELSAGNEIAKGNGQANANGQGSGNSGSGNGQAAANVGGVGAGGAFAYGHACKGKGKGC